MANSPERIPIKPPIVTFHTAENKWICLKLNSMLHIVQAFQDKNYISVHVIQFLISFLDMMLEGDYFILLEVKIKACSNASANNLFL